MENLFNTGEHIVDKYTFRTNFLSKSNLSIIEPKHFSFGTVEECKVKIKDLMCYFDKSITQLIWVDEYDEVAKWLSDTKGKGLFLTGHVGRGKTVLTKYVIPYLFSGKFINLENLSSTSFSLDFLSHNDILENYIPSNINIDDIGLEGVVNKFGTAIDLIPIAVNDCERSNKLLILTSNLNSIGLTDRYGIRTVDRINKLCKVVSFSGKSFR